MPMLAYFEEREPEGDRRRSVRRSLRLGAAAGGATVTIHDLSLTGALLETSVPMLVGAEFEVELPDAGRTKAAIVWNSGEFYGCQFNLPISPAVLSAALLQSAPEQQRVPEHHDPVEELKELNAEVELLAIRMESALERLSRKE